MCGCIYVYDELMAFRSNSAFVIGNSIVFMAEPLAEDGLNYFGMILH
jgi:hypothetical protein